MGKSVMETIFDGPDSVMGKIFGSTTSVRRTKPNRVQVSLTAEQLAAVQSGVRVIFRADGLEIVVGVKP